MGINLLIEMDCIYWYLYRPALCRAKGKQEPKPRPFKWMLNRAAKGSRSPGGRGFPVQGAANQP